MKLAVALAVLPAAAAFVGPAAAPAETRLSESKSDLEALAKGLNPTIGFWDPLNVAGASGSLYGFNNEQTIAWYRQAEIKHGRVAMAAFVGYCVQANGGHWATKMTLGGPNLCGNHAASWVILAPRIEQKSDSVLSRRRGLAVRLPAGAVGRAPGREQVANYPLRLVQRRNSNFVVAAMAFGRRDVLYAQVGMLELFDESVAPHYMMGRKPGMFPSFSDAYAEGEGYPHPVPFDLFDPFGSLRKRMDTEEKRARGRLIEINNGRAAMLGIFGFMSASKVPGSVPVLTFIPPYDGNYMIPFEGNFHMPSMM